jgi:signal transduction histidine kinase
MNRSLMIIMVMGVLAMVLMAGMGSFFVGKVGGAENVHPLKKELAGVFSFHMKDPRALKVRVKKDEDGEGVLVSYEVNPDFDRDERSRNRQIKRLASHILVQPEWSRLSYVEVALTLPDGRIREARFERTPVPE